MNQQQDLVSIYIEPRPGAKSITGGINGSFFRVETGKQVLVPVPIAQALQNAENLKVRSDIEVGRFLSSTAQKECEAL